MAHWVRTSTEHACLISKTRSFKDRRCGNVVANLNGLAMKVTRTTLNAQVLILTERSRKVAPPSTVARRTDREWARVQAAGPQRAGTETTVVGGGAASGFQCAKLLVDVTSD